MDVSSIFIRRFTNILCICLLPFHFSWAIITVCSRLLFFASCINRSICLCFASNRIISKCCSFTTLNWILNPFFSYCWKRALRNCCCARLYANSIALLDKKMISKVRCKELKKNANICFWLRKMKMKMR